MQNPTVLAELRQAVSNDPGNAQLHYLLGAELAESGEYENAISALTSAVAIDPQLHTARFQLGLLYLTMAQPQQSMAVLAALDSLPDDNALKHFKHGLQALAADDFDGCVASLQRGIKLNSTNPVLNGDMTLIIERINDTRSAQSKAVAAPVEASPRRAGQEPRRTDFKLYKDIEES